MQEAKTLIWISKTDLRELEFGILEQICKNKSNLSSKLEWELALLVVASDALHTKAKAAKAWKLWLRWHWWRRLKFNLWKTVAKDLKDFGDCQE